MRCGVVWMGGDTHRIGVSRHNVMVHSDWKYRSFSETILPPNLKSYAPCEKISQMPKSRNLRIRLFICLLATTLSWIHFAQGLFGFLAMCIGGAHDGWMWVLFGWSVESWVGSWIGRVVVVVVGRAETGGFLIGLDWIKLLRFPLETLIYLVRSVLNSRLFVISGNWRKQQK